MYVCMYVTDIVQNSDVRQMYMNAQTEWLNHLKVCIVMKVIGSVVVDCWTVVVMLVIEHGSGFDKQNNVNGAVIMTVIARAANRLI